MKDDNFNICNRSWFLMILSVLNTCKADYKDVYIALLNLTEHNILFALNKNTRQMAGV